MKKKELLRCLKYTMFACSAGLIEIISYALLEEFTSWNYWGCYLTALVLSVIWNFTLNRKFTFHSANNVAVAMAKVFGYYLVFTPLSTLLGNYAAEVLMWNGYTVTLLNMLANGITEYLFQRHIVFGKSIDTDSGIQAGSLSAKC